MATAFLVAPALREAMVSNGLFKGARAGGFVAAKRSSGLVDEHYTAARRWIQEMQGIISWRGRQTSCINDPTRLLKRLREFAKALQTRSRLVDFGTDVTRNCHRQPWYFRNKKTQSPWGIVVEISNNYLYPRNATFER